jgi:hypothetical protein
MHFIAVALQAGNGRAARCESKAELIKRLEEDQASYDPADLPAALSLLESGELQHIPHRLRRMPPKSQVNNPWAEPGPDWGLMLEFVRSY